MILTTIILSVLKQQMFNLTTLNHFLLVAWPCLQRIFTSKKRITALHTISYQNKRLLFTIMHCSPYTISSLPLRRSAAQMTFGPSHPLTPSCNL